MIIAFDATSLGSGLGGDETATRSLLRGLAAVLEDDQRVVLLAAAGAELPLEVLGHPGFSIDRTVRRRGAVHFTHTLPRWLRALMAHGERPDVVVSLTHAPLRCPAPVALLVPDLSFVHQPETYPRSTRLRLQTLIGRQVGRASVVLTVSDFSRTDLITSYQLPAAKVHAVPLNIDPPHATGLAEARSGLADRGVRAPFLLYLGNLHPRKNVPLAIRAFRAEQAMQPALREHQLVIAGRRWFGSDAEEHAAAGAEPGRILFLDRVSDPEREVLLWDAAALVYLSTFEGFGLPPLEAMARATPVLASNATAIPEVCGDAALLVDPNRPDQVRDGVRRVLLDRPLRSELVRRGWRRAGLFDSVRTGEALMKALVAASRGTGSVEMVRHRAS